MGSMSQNEDTLLDVIDSVDYNGFSDNASRRKVLQAAQSLVRRLQHPIEAVWDVALVYPALYSALKVGVDLNLFVKLDSENGRPKTTVDLADGGDTVLLSRVLRHLAAMDFIDELDVDLWGPTRLSTAMTQRPVFAHVDFVGDTAYSAFVGLPRFLKDTKYRDPSDATRGNWQSVIECDKTYFEWMAERPRVQQTFWDLMDGVASQPGFWTDVYPIKKIMSDTKADCTVLVDIGGAEGRDLQTFVQRFPEASGRVVLQDQEAVISTVPHLRNEGVAPMAHDFFTEQPVKGALIYFVHRVLHDWPDDKAREILCNIKPAMVPGHSRLIINDVVLPPKGATSDQTGIDLTMMALVSGSERSEGDWKHLIQSCGLQVMGFYHSFASKDAVIEVELSKD